MMIVLLYLFLFLLSTTIVAVGGVANTIVTTNTTTTSDKTQYVVGETIRFTQIGDAVPSSSHDYIIPESFLPTFLASPTQPRWTYGGCPTENVYTTTGTTTRTITTRTIICSFQWQHITGLNAALANAEYPMLSDVSLKTNLTLVQSENLQMKFVYVHFDFYMDGNAPRTKVYSISNPFTFKLNDINITLNKTSYVQGEMMQLKFQQSIGTELVPSYNDDLYMKVYEVPFSYKYDLLQFNNAIQVKYASSYADPSLPPIDKQLITWHRSGQFQMVLFQNYYHIVLAVSDVFTVQVQRNLTNFNVSMNNRTYYPHQYIAFDVSVAAAAAGNSDQSLVGRQVSFTFVTAKTTQRDLANVTKVLDTFTQTWTSSTLSEQFLIMNTMVKRGFYKVFVSISAVSSSSNNNNGGTNFAIHTTKSFRIVSPLITMTTNPSRRRYIQGEVINFTFYNPYFDFELYRNEYWAHDSYVVDAKFPNPNDTNPIIQEPAAFDWLPISNQKSEYYRNLRIYLPPGQYKVIIVRRRSNVPDTFITSVPNTLFTVVSNNFTLTSDKDNYTKGEIVFLQISTERKIPLTGEPPIYWYLTNRGDPNASYIATESKVFDQSSSSGTVLISSINTAWYVPGVYALSVSRGTVRKQIVIQ